MKEANCGINLILGFLSVALITTLSGCGKAPEGDYSDDITTSSSIQHDHDHDNGHDDHDHGHEDDDHGHDDHDHGHDDHDHGHDDHDHGHDDHDHDEHGDHSDDGDKGHHHEAPHGGTLVALGDHFAHLELVLDDQNGQLTAYALDGGAEGAVRLAQKEIKLSISVEADSNIGAQTAEVVLSAVANPLTGESVGDTSQFDGQSNFLVGLKHFDCVVEQLTIKGSDLSDIEFEFPEGNE